MAPNMAASEDPEDSTVPNLLFSGSSQSSFACNFCKKKKIKCDKVAPQCSNCQKSGRTCEYPLSVPKPGPKAGSTRKRQLQSPDKNGESQSRVRRNSDRSGEAADIDSSLSEIVHPPHNDSVGYSYLERHMQLPNEALYSTNNGTALKEALASLALSGQDLQAWVNIYFDHMTAFSLFHRPSFERKLSLISSATEIQSLLLAIIAICRSCTDLSPGTSNTLKQMPPWAIWERSRYLLRECLDSSGDEPPPLHLLQTLILVSWQHLYRGVRGRGWRSLGRLVRLCYELRLHQEDTDKNSDRSWIEREERRRVWWATWELDVFASTMKRLPTAIDWTTNRTHLPMPDSCWFSGAACNSVYLHADPALRWKELEKSGNHASGAWFIIFNSYKYEAYLLSTAPQSLPIRVIPEPHGRINLEDVRRHRDVLVNCLHCAQLAMPEQLRVHDRFLSFRANERTDDAWRYCNHLMIQASKFMLYRQDIFLAHRKQARSSQRSDSGPNRLAWERIIASAGEAVNVIRNSAPEHVRLVNPCIANAIWFTASALVVGQVMGPKSIDRHMLTSNFDLLRATIKQFARTNKVPEMLVHSLDALEENLRRLNQKRGEGQGAEELAPLASPDSSNPIKSPIISDTGISQMTPISETSTLHNDDLLATDLHAQFDIPKRVDMPLFDDTQFDLTQTDGLDQLMSLTDDWCFNLDFIRCPYE